MNMIDVLESDLRLNYFESSIMWTRLCRVSVKKLGKEHQISLKETKQCSIMRA